MSRTVIHKRSEVEGLKPSINELLDGEIAVNYNVKTPSIFIKDNSDNIVSFKDEKYYGIKLNEKVDKIEGKGLSTEDFTVILKTKLESLTNYDDSDIRDEISKLKNDLSVLVDISDNDKIDSIKEIINFLNGVNDTESLTSIISSLENQISDKQDALVSGVTIKTINNESILGEGNIEINVSVSEDDLKDYAKKSDLENKQDIITDLEDIRVNASKGATALQSNSLKTINGESIVGEGNIEISGSISEDDLKDYAKKDEVALKQDVLVSGENIKTINGISILGSGNIDIEGGEGGGSDIDLSDYITKGDLEAALATKQDTLISGENINIDLLNNKVTINDIDINFKTINTNNILGEGNINIEGGGGGPIINGPNVVATFNNLSTEDGLIYTKYNTDAIINYNFRYYNNGSLTSKIGDVIIKIQRKDGNNYIDIKTIENKNVNTGLYTLDIKEYITDEAKRNFNYRILIDVKVDGVEAQTYFDIIVVYLDLEIGYNMNNMFSDGKYGYSSDFYFTYTTTQSVGGVILYTYVDDIMYNNVEINTSTTGQYTIFINDLISGSHRLQIVAEHTLSGVKTKSYYFDFLKSYGNNEIKKPFIGISSINENGIIVKQQENVTLSTKQYEQLNINYIAYNPNKQNTDVNFYQNNSFIKKITLNEPTIQTYNSIFYDSGLSEMKLECDGIEYFIDINVDKIETWANEVKDSLVFKLTSFGRTNNDENKNIWEYNNGKDVITTSFENVNFKSNGWLVVDEIKDQNGNITRKGIDALVLNNGAKVTINKRIFDNKTVINGKTIEFEYKVVKVVEKNKPLIYCLNDNGKVGILVTSEDANLYSGPTKFILNPDDVNIKTEVPIGVATKFDSDMWLKISFVINKPNNDNEGLVELYVNGIRCGADVYSTTNSFKDIELPLGGIVFDSAYADIYIRNVRVYDMSLNDDQILSNFITIPSIS